MSPLAGKHEPVTICAFDLFLQGQAEGDLDELVGGPIVMMTNPNQRHEQIVSNIGAHLKLTMHKRGCRTYQGGMRIEHYRRVPGGWETDVLTKPEDELTLEAVAFQMPPAQAYFDIDFG